MNGSTLSVRLGIFGATAMLALGVGCSKGNQQHAKSAKTKPTPAFESAVPEGQTSEGQAGQGQTGQGQTGQGQTGQGTTGMQGHVGMMSEREMCSSLTAHGSLRAEDIDGGVAIVAAPASGTEPTTLRTDALHIAYALTPPAGQEAQARPQDSSDRCPLFDLRSITSRTSVVEQGNDVRILLLAHDPSEVATLRAQARAFIQSWGKKH
jgi:hypothetical protein